MAVLVAANFLDAGSSIGRYEANPLLRNSQGQFSGPRAVMYKSAAVGGMIGLQLLCARRQSDSYSIGTIVNVAAAGALTATAIRNRGIPPATPAVAMAASNQNR